MGGGGKRSDWWVRKLNPDLTATSVELDQLINTVCLVRVLLF